MAFRYFVGLAGEKSFIPLTWTKPDRLSGLIKFALLRGSTWQAGGELWNLTARTMATRQTAPGKSVDNRKSSLSLCVSTANRCTRTSARCPERELWAVREAPLSFPLLLLCSVAQRAAWMEPLFPGQRQWKFTSRGTEDRLGTGTQAKRLQSAIWIRPTGCYPGFLVTRTMLCQRQYVEERQGLRWKTRKLPQTQLSECAAQNHLFNFCFRQWNWKAKMHSYQFFQQ